MLILFLISSLSIFTERMEFPLNYNPKIESTGSTGMIYGGEFGAFYLSPTSKFKKNNLFSFGLNFDSNLSKYGFRLRGNYKNLLLGFHYLEEREEKTNNLFGSLPSRESKLFIFPIRYVYDYNNITIGSCLKFINSPSAIISKGLRIANIFTIDLGVLNKSDYGKMAISINNLISPCRDQVKKEITYFAFKPNLKIGYANSFEIKYWREKIKVAVEIHDLLKYSGDFKSTFRKLHLGTESFHFVKGCKVNLRSGFSNCFLTFGFGLEFSIFKLDYSYSTKFDKLKDKNVNLNSFSFSINENL